MDESITRHRRQKAEHAKEEKFKTFADLENIKTKLKSKERVYIKNLEDKSSKAHRHNDVATCKAYTQKEKDRHSIEILMQQTEKYDKEKKVTIVEF